MTSAIELRLTSGWNQPVWVSADECCRSLLLKTRVRTPSHDNGIDQRLYRRGQKDNGFSWLRSGSGAGPSQHCGHPRPCRRCRRDKTTISSTLAHQEPVLPCGAQAGAQSRTLRGHKTVDTLAGFLLLTTHFGAVAQLGERLNGIQEVRGSTPRSSTRRHKRVRETIFNPFLHSCHPLATPAPHNHRSMTNDRHPLPYLRNL